MTPAPKVGSLFSGVEGFGMGLEAAGFEVAWQVEIDKDAVSVLERHYPNVRRYRDVREVKGAELEPVDVLVGGFPCQDLSVAGARKGLAGSRSGLFFEVARIAAETAAPWLLLENVPGLLSSFTPVEPPPSDVPPGTEWTVEETSDFGVVLSTLAEYGYGFCTRVLDAEYLGVPQRRERVFIVGCLGATGARAAEVLLEPESVLRDLASCLEARQGAPGVSQEGAGSGGVADVAFTLPSTSGRNEAGDRVGNAWNTTYVPELSDCLRANDDSFGGQQGASAILAQVSETLRSHPRPGSNSVGNIVAAPLTAGGHPDSNAPGRHREDDENLVVAAWDERNITSGAIRTRCEPGLPANTLHSEGQAVAFNWQSGGDVRLGFTEEGTTALHASQTPAVSVMGAAVRRLMPVECERLMGWQDGHTERRADGSLIPDGPRYRMIGNGVVAPVAAWLGRRLRRALDAAPEHGAAGARGGAG